MDSVLRAQARFGQRALLLTTAAVPLTGWAVHAVTLHKKIAASRRDPLTGLLRRDAYTVRARHLLARHGDDTTLVMVDADHFKAINDRLGRGGRHRPRVDRGPPHGLGGPARRSRPAWR